jgi:hypothetical protein
MGTRRSMYACSSAAYSRSRKSSITTTPCWDKIVAARRRGCKGISLLMVNTSRLRGEVLQEDPFEWLSCASFLDEDVAFQLARRFPIDGLSISTAIGSRFESRSLISDGVIDYSWNCENQDWIEFAKYLISKDYHDLISDVMKIDLANCTTSAAICRYRTDSFNGAHTDRSHRVVSQIIYLNRVWMRAWGGDFLILRAPDISAVASRVAPAFNTMVAFIRSERSWHAVAPLSPGSDVERRSILIHFSKR